MPSVSRNGVFETNSSSMHALSIGGCAMTRNEYFRKVVERAETSSSGSVVTVSRFDTNGDGAVYLDDFMSKLSWLIQAGYDAWASFSGNELLSVTSERIALYLKSPIYHSIANMAERVLNENGMFEVDEFETRENARIGLSRENGDCTAYKPIRLSTSEILVPGGMFDIDFNIAFPFMDITSYKSIYDILSDPGIRIVIQTQ